MSGSGTGESDELNVDHIDHSDQEIDASAMMGSATDGKAVEDDQEHAADAEDVEHAGEDADGSDEEETIAVGEEITDAAEIDWEALWEEFGFDTPDAIDSVIQPETRVVGALECSEQGIGGKAETHISDAVENGTLKKKETPNGALRGYLLEAMLE